MKQELTKLCRESGAFQRLDQDEHSCNKPKDGPGDLFPGFSPSTPLPVPRSEEQRKCACHGDEGERKAQSSSNHIANRHQTQHQASVAKIALVCNGLRGWG